MSEATPTATPASHWRRYRMFYLLIAVTVTPVLASYTAYYLLPPSGRTNYGALIEPQRPTPALPLRALDGSDFDLRSLQGRWVFVMVDGGDCEAACVEKLFHMRQQRTMTGKDRDRIERVWLITDRTPLATVLMREFEGTHFVRAPVEPLRMFLPLPAAPNARLEDHIWIIDPLGNLMLRWPRNPDPSRTKRDIAKLLRASANWVRIENKD
jgi:hypothetical protein